MGHIRHLFYCLWALLFISNGLLGEFEAGFDTTRTPDCKNELWQAITDSNCEPSTFVGGVNVITGSFCDSSVDMVIPGANPIILQRFYSSSDAIGHQGNQGSLCHSWNINHVSKIDVYNKIGQIVLTENGSSTLYERTWNPKTGQRVYSVAKKLIDLGLTNTAYGPISARTNPLNSYIDSKSLITPFGSRKYYANLYMGEANLSREYCLREVLPNHNTFAYKYASKAPGKLEKISSTNCNGAEFSYIQFEHDFKTNFRTVAYTSDNRAVIYNFVKQDKNFFLTSVQNEFGISENYLYENKYSDGSNYAYRHRLVKKYTDPNHFLEIEYYKQGNIPAADSIYSLYCVKTLRAPLGTDNSPITLYTFNYRINADSYSTLVTDAHRNQKEYFYNTKKQLTRITEYANQTAFRHQKFFWNNGNLVTRAVESANATLLCCHFNYDSSHNVKTETIYGNLTGACTLPVLLNEKGIPQQNGCECYQKNYEYAYLSGYSLLQKESDDRKTITYSYKEGTDLLAAKYTWNGACVSKRQFKEYDINGVVTKEIEDNGIYQDSNNLIGATERHIKEIISTPSGLPHKVYEKYWDFDTNQELLLKATIYEYDPYGKVIEEKRFDNQLQYLGSYLYEYDKRGNLLKETNPLGEVTLRSYDAHNNLIEGITPHGNRTLYAYDFSNRLIKKTEYDILSNQCLTESYAYNYLSQKVSSIDCHGNETKYVYDPLGRLVQTIYPQVLDENLQMIQPIETTYYDELGNPVIKIDPKGNQTHAQYNVRGQPCHIRYADGSEEQYRYTLDGLLETSIDKDGTVTRYAYDYQGRPLEILTLTPGGELLKKWTGVYDAFHLLRETDLSGLITEYTYDSAGRLVVHTKGEERTEYVYDTFNRLFETREYFGENAGEYLIKRNYYDTLDRIVSEEKSSPVTGIQHKVDYKYDAEGNQSAIIKYTLNGPAETRFFYLNNGKPFAKIDPLGNRTDYRYVHNYCNEQGQTVAYEEIIDPEGNSKITIYDTLKRPTMLLSKNAFNAFTQKEELYYDANGNLSYTIQTILTPHSPDKHVVHVRKYDCMNRWIELIEAYKTPDQRTTGFFYNQAGQKVLERKPDGNELYSFYDPLGRLQKFFSKDGTIHYEYIYDLQDNPIQIIDYVNNQTTRRTYSINGYLLNEILGTELQLGYTYDKLGRIKQVTLPDAGSFTFQYNGQNLQTIKRYNPQAEFVYQHEYTNYDCLGNWLSATLINGKQISRHFDPVNRQDSFSTPYFKEECAYSPAGNMISKTRQSQGLSKEFSYAYDALYQLTQEKSDREDNYLYDSQYNRLLKNDQTYENNLLNRTTSDSLNHYQYDLNGNLIQSGSREYTYDALNRLIAIKDGEHVSRYTYDPFNRRLSKNVDGVTTNYLYQGQDEIGALQSGTITELRVLGNGKGAEISAAVSVELNGKPYVPLHDLHGNVSCLIDPTSDQAAGKYEFTAFGEESCAGILSPWRFSSKRVDEETGYVYFGRRYYDPILGKWITADPAGYEDGPNLYAYVKNNPLIHFDLYGLWRTMTSEERRERRESLDRFYASAVHNIFYAVDCCESAWAATVDIGKSLGSGVIDSVAHPIDTSVELGLNQGTDNARKVGQAIGLGVQAYFLAGAVVQVGKLGINVAAHSYKCVASRGVVNLTAKQVAINDAKVILAKEATNNTLLTMRNSGKVLDKGTLTKAGRALDKHGNRSGSIFPKATGNPESKNLQGQKILDDILFNQDSIIKPNRWGGVDVLRPDGAGVRFQNGFNFKGFLEP